MKLTEVVDLKPDERERLGLPSYIDSILPRAQALAAADEFPVNVREDKWKVVDGDPKRLTRTFHFEDPRIRASFLLELIDYEEQVQHHPKVTMIGDKVKIELWTHDVNDVTEIDLEFAREVDDIVDDVHFHFRS